MKSQVVIGAGVRSYIEITFGTASFSLTYLQ